VQPTETGKVEITLSSDPRLLAGVSGAVNHVAEAAGMDESSRANLVAAIEDACHAAFDQLPEDKSTIQLMLGSAGSHIDAVLMLKGSAAKSDRPEKIQRALTGRIVLVKNISTHTAKR
jgi:hypothetical protein